MVLETSNTPAPAPIKSTTRRRVDDNAGVVSQRNLKRCKRIPDEDAQEYAAASCLVSLARCGGAAITTAGTDVKSGEKKLYYKCGVCGKTFPSYQALGGHKTSHRDKPPTTAAGAANFSGNSNFASGPNPNPTIRAHKCTICHENFPTGQALGGHKRKHYQGVIGRKGGANCSEDGSAASGVTSTDGGAVSHSQSGGDDVMAPISRNFDLNLPPPPELDLMLTFM
ncbi:zinc finger protein [Castilleja foliolosa]|uniref:Zinc finger protein n=1 Tax=Castilleja foliolosa TaxID=1961234 RepID=A0ABD3EBM6_9LAMI